MKRIREEDILREYAGLVVMQVPAAAKYRYVQLCRSLRTFGVALFEVRERWVFKFLFVYVCK